jgi:glycosyltransferase involved in cell wall biosynthesis
LNVLFVLYHDFTANSASHVHSLANALTDLGASCSVCVPSNLKSASTIGGEAQYRPLLYQDVISGDFGFADGRGPDITHAWTPREIIRRFLESAKLPGKLVIHLEDNEEHLTARSMGRKWSDLAERTSLADLDAGVPAQLSHPIRYKQLMRQADAATVIVERLSELVPNGKPIEEVWCSADEALFREVPVDHRKRAEIGVPSGTTVIVYPGNVHPANAAEVRSLYTAVALLNREGYPTALVRAGRDFHPYLEGDGKWARQYCVDLGLVAHKDMPAVLATADLFVQPGRPGEFNDYRFPSKLPEFFAIGRPVILPAANIGLHMRHREDAYIVQEANAMNITSAAIEIIRDPQLAARLSRGARRFFDERLSWKQDARKLQALYTRLLIEGQ